MINKSVGNGETDLVYGYELNCDDGSIEVTADSLVDWMDVNVTSDEIQIHISENKTGSRSGIVEIYVGSTLCSSKSISVSQDAGEGGECYYSLTASTNIVECEGERITISYKKTDSGKGGGDIKFYLNGSTSPSTETTVDCNTESISLMAEVPSGPSGDVEEMLHRAAALYCNNTSTQAGFETSYTKHHPTTANGSKHITINIKNTGTTYLAYNGNFVINDGSTDYLACYREPSSTDNGKHWYYCEGNKILAPQGDITIEVPLERTIGNTTQNIAGKALSSFKFYTAIVGSDGYMSNKAVYLSNGGSITKVSGPNTVIDGETYQLNISVANINNYLFSSEDLRNGYHVHDDIVVPTDLDEYK